MPKEMNRMPKIKLPPINRLLSIRNTVIICMVNYWIVPIIWPNSMKLHRFVRAPVWVEHAAWIMKRLPILIFVPPILLLVLLVWRELQFDINLCLIWLNVIVIVRHPIVIWIVVPKMNLPNRRNVLVIEFWNILPIVPAVVHPKENKFNWNLYRRWTEGVEVKKISTLWNLFLFFQYTKKKKRNRKYVWLYKN